MTFVQPNSLSGKATTIREPDFSYIKWMHHNISNGHVDWKKKDIVAEVAKQTGRSTSTVYRVVAVDTFEHFVQQRREETARSRAKKQEQAEQLSIKLAPQLSSKVEKLDEFFTTPAPVAETEAKAAADYTAELKGIHATLKSIEQLLRDSAEQRANMKASDIAVKEVKRSRKPLWSR